MQMFIPGNPAQELGYTPKTTFWEDFSIADKFGLAAVKDTYNRAFDAWKSDHIYLTELVLVLNWKIGQHYYYLGLSKAETPLEGTYYYFDGLEDIGNGNMKPAVYYENDREAIRQAADIEATLYKCEYKNGDQVTSQVIYEPKYY